MLSNILFESIFMFVTSMLLLYSIKNYMARGNLQEFFDIQWNSAKNIVDKEERIFDNRIYTAEEKSVGGYFVRRFV